MPAVVSDHLPNVYWLTAVWIFGGLIALIGALCFAELTTTYPDRGGDYGYLKRSYHRHVGFAFSWAAFWVIRPGNIGSMAMIFAEYAAQVYPTNLPPLVYACGSVVLISLLNLIGIQAGKLAQNVLTVSKVLGILFIVFAAFFLWAPSSEISDDSVAGESVPVENVVETEDDLSDESRAESSSAGETSGSETDKKALWGSFWLAMVFVMFTFGGWNDIAFVATEVQEPKKNLLRALVLGTICVLLVYLVFIFALVYGIGFERMSSLGSQWGNPASELITQRMGETGNRFFAVLVCVSCLGAINAMVFTSPRIYWATAADYPSLSWLAGSKSGAGWWRAMLLQMFVTLILILSFNSKDGVADLVAATAPYFWIFLALTIVGLMVCRHRFEGQFAGYRVPFYPVTPLLFVAVCGFMTFQCWVHMLKENLAFHAILIAGWVVVGIGLGVFLGWKRKDEAAER